MADASTFAKIKIGIASPEEIRNWSFGEVKKPETINYRTFKPERDGLFCERIFGPVKDWECHCGRYKKVKHKGITCDRCGVEVTRSKVRRERMGHIELVAPVAHIWYHKNQPSPLSLILDISSKLIERVLYFQSYIVTRVDKEKITASYSEIRREVDVEIAQLQVEKSETADRMRREFNKRVQNHRNPNPEPVSEEPLDEDVEPSEEELIGGFLDYENLDSTNEYWDDETVARKEANLVESIRQAENDIDERIERLMQAADQMEKLEPKQLISEDQFRAIEHLIDVLANRIDETWRNAVEAGQGAAAIRDLLVEIDLDTMSRELRVQIANTLGPRRLRLLKRLEMAEAFIASRTRPEWMIMEAVPVISPELRPMVQLEGGRFATSDLNDLYRRIINRNNRLKRITEIRAPESIVNHEKRLLQEAVDALIDNAKRQRPVTASNNRPLKSLSELLKGKEGRFRKNLLGKRVDYSGRSVIVVGPYLKLHQCGLPKEMALELFKPFVMKTLVGRGYTNNIKAAKKMIEKARPEVWDALEEVIREHPVLLNRAPTLHRLGIQAFEPVLVDGKAIQVHPLVCHAFNADFDGDMMAVHVPLSAYAQAEARILMLSSNNLFSPANGGPIVAPVQDIILGAYYLTMMKSLKPTEEPERRVYASAEEAMLAYSVGDLGLHDPIAVKLPHRMSIDADAEVRDEVVGLVWRHDDDGENGRWTYRTADGMVNVPADEVHLAAEKRCTTVGRLIFAQILPERLKYTDRYLLRTMNKKAISTVVSDVYETHGKECTIRFLDELKDIGFKYAMKGGVSIAITDMDSPMKRHEIISETEQKVRTANRQYSRGQLSQAERKSKVLELWLKAAEDVAGAIMEGIEQYNPIYIITDSGARGSTKQVTQLSGMRGLMTDPFGNLIEELPIKSNFHEGLSVLEFFVSTHGARKGMADTALRTADAGYLTRKLVDVAQDMIIRDVDCGTTNGLDMSEIMEGGEVLERVSERIRGRYPTFDLVHPITNELLVPANTDIPDTIARMLDDVRICKDDIVEMETGTVIYHKGDALYLKEVASLLDRGVRRAGALRADKAADSHTDITTSMKVRVRSVLTCELRQGICACCYGRDLANGRLVDIGVAVGIVAAQSIGEPGTQLTMRTFHTGGIAGKDLTGDKRTNKSKRRSQQEVLLDDMQRGVVNFDNVEGSERERNRAIQSVLKVLEDPSRGLNRVTELFEARKPKGEAIVTTVAGYVAEIQTGGLRNVVIHTQAELNETMAHQGLGTDAVAAEDIFAGGEGQGDPIVKAGEQITDRHLRKIVASGITHVLLKRVYMVPYRGEIPVEKGQYVQPGDPLTYGPLNPQTVLTLQGVQGVQEYLVREIQSVYKGQGVDINDKHIEVIVRQMLRKRKVRHPGDSRFLMGQIVDKFVFEDENTRVRNIGGTEATADWVLFGIAEASLSTESFLSAASFQKTTRVLTEAAVRGKRDELIGLKENVIIGRLIPAGTGLAYYRSLEPALPDGTPIQVDLPRPSRPVSLESDIERFKEIPAVVVDDSVTLEEADTFRSIPTQELDPVVVAEEKRSTGTSGLELLDQNLPLSPTNVDDEADEND